MQTEWQTVLILIWVYTVCAQARLSVLRYMSFFQSGKTALSNFLADATETSSGEYHPTQAVRYTSRLLTSTTVKILEIQTSQDCCSYPKTWTTDVVLP